MLISMTLQFQELKSEVPLYNPGMVICRLFVVIGGRGGGEGLSLRLYYSLYFMLIWKIMRASAAATSEYSKFLQPRSIEKVKIFPPLMFER